MEDYHKITCPHCQSVLVVERRTGKIIEVRKPIVEDSTGDRFEDAFLKVKGKKEEIEKKVEEAKKRESEKMGKLDALFNEEVEKAKKEGIQKPENPFDFE